MWVLVCEYYTICGHWLIICVKSVLVSTKLERYWWLCFLSLHIFVFYHDSKVICVAYSLKIGVFKLYKEIYSHQLKQWREYSYFSTPKPSYAVTFTDEFPRFACILSYSIIFFLSGYDYDSLKGKFTLSKAPWMSINVQAKASLCWRVFSIFFTILCSEIWVVLRVWYACCIERLQKGFDNRIAKRFHNSILLLG